MFGYVITNCKTLSDEQGRRFRELYCGMCRSLKKRYGQLPRFTLSYDMTFLALVLSALYECEERQGTERCLPHMIKPHSYVENEMIDYAADMNILLAYGKLRDDVQDDHSPAAMAGSALLRGAYRKASEKWPKQSAKIDEWLRMNAKIEAEGERCVDVGMNLTGDMLGTLMMYKGDFFPEDLYRMGEGLGRFIYLMDAYEDLEKDIRKKRYNALRDMALQADYEDLIKASLKMVIADCADAFECLPIVRDADLIRNIIYSGVWSKYLFIQEKKSKQTGLKEHKDAGSL